MEGIEQFRHATVSEPLPVEAIAETLAHLQRDEYSLAALAGPSIQQAMEIRGAALPVRMNGEDLTRALVNLVKNAAEAMPAGGRMRAVLRQLDPGPGIAPALLESIFDPGFTTRSAGDAGPSGHRGVGLAVTRSSVESAGGRIGAENLDPPGACFRIVLPVPEC